MKRNHTLLWAAVVLLSILSTNCGGQTNSQGIATPNHSLSGGVMAAKAASPTQEAGTPTVTASGNLTETITLPIVPSEKSIKTVFLIVMENHDWSSIQGNPSAPYINKTLLPQASYALNYHNPPGNHPSEPNYLWLEAGTNFGIHNDDWPDKNHQSTTQHLVALLQNAGISWKAYEENISGKECPLTGTRLYAPEHNPMIFFDDVTNNNDPNSSECITHERPFSELAGDLQSNQVARYNFITPNRCDDMHNFIGCATLNSVKNGDDWLSKEVPVIMNSKAYQDGGVLFITWDEAEGSDGPIGMIVLSPLAKGNGYTNKIYYTHSSTLRTVEEIFGVKPLLGDAAKASDLSDFFKVFP